MKCLGAGDRGFFPQRLTTRITWMLALVTIMTMAWDWQFNQSAAAQGQAQSQTQVGANDSNLQGRPVQLAFQGNPAGDTGAPDNTATPAVQPNPATDNGTTAVDKAASSEDRLPTPVELWRTSPWIISIILVLSVIALLAFVFLLLTVNHNAMVPATFVDDVMKMVLAKEYKQAVDYCRNHRAIFVSSIIQRCVENVDKEHAVLMDMVDTEGKRRADILWNRVSYLSDIANVAPMLGLLGTVIGMMRAFFRLDSVDISVKSRALSSDIAGAMATTMFGLIVAIMALAFFSIIKGRATRVLAEAEQAVHAVADHIKRGEA
jgi:biopolymer transport protein ExbB